MATNIRGEVIRARIGGMELAKPYPGFIVTNGTDFVGIQFGNTISVTLSKVAAEELAMALRNHADVVAAYQNR